jgi:conjugal transfer pilus assembly protein TraI
LLAQWFGPRPASPALPAPPAAHAAAATAEYPAVDPGLPAIAVAEVIAPHAEWLKRLRYAYGAEAATFERDIGGVVERYARYVHLLPATPDSHFRQAGGLFRMGLEIGFYALQATDGAIFSGRQTITQRSALEPRWRYATFLAGLCSELYRMSHVTVTNDRGEEWPAYLQPLSTWLHDTGSRRYHLRWQPHPEDTRAVGVVAMSHIVAPAILYYLAQGNSVVIPHFMASLSGTVLEREANTLDHLVRRAAALVVERDLSANIDLPVQPPPSADVERHLVAAMRRLVVRRRWVPNTDTSPLWHGEDGLFLLWPQAAADMLEGLRDEQSTGIKLEHDPMATRLATASTTEPRPDLSTLEEHSRVPKHRRHRR